MPLAVHLLMRTPELLRLRDAFQRDRQQGADPTFCAERIASIEQVLRERGELPEDEEAR